MPGHYTLTLHSVLIDRTCDWKDQNTKEPSNVWWLSGPGISRPATDVEVDLWNQASLQPALNAEHLAAYTARAGMSKYRMAELIGAVLAGRDFQAEVDTLKLKLQQAGEKAMEIAREFDQVSLGGKTVLDKLAEGFGLAAPSKKAWERGGVRG